MLRSAILGVLLTCFSSLSCWADLVLLGRVNNTTPDSFSFAALRDLNPGEIFYFTDNGWTGAGFRGASANDGDGNEDIMRFTANAPISAGTLILSNSTSGSFTFTTSGAIPGATTGTFGNLVLAQTGDQIYAFTGQNSNPLNNPISVLFALDDTNGFEVATTNATGALPIGTLGISLDAADPGGVRLVNDGAFRTRSEWEAYVTTATNWTAGTNLSVTGNLNISAVPEPSSLVFVGLVGCLVWTSAYRHRKLKKRVD